MAAIHRYRLLEKSEVNGRVMRAGEVVWLREEQAGPHMERLSDEKPPEDEPAIPAEDIATEKKAAPSEAPRHEPHNKPRKRAAKK